jgi:hypothetical protein
MDVGQEKGFLIAENAECPHVLQNGASFFAANAKSIPART